MAIMRAVAHAGVVVLIALWPSAALAEQMKLYQLNPSDPLDHKAIVALLRAAKVGNLDTHQIRLTTTDQFNAFYCGHNLFVAGRPLLNLPQWAIDAVMAHEVGHFVYRHVELRSDLEQAVMSGLRELGASIDRQNPNQGAQIGAQVGHLAVTLFEPKYTQGQELQADAYAVDALRAEGYAQPGNAMANALALIERLVGPSGGGFFATHPSFEDRINKLRGR